ncbi:MAG: hypothetical protein R3E03_06300 [Novosphingobium sp.]
MLEFPTWKKVWLWAITLVFALSALPSIFSVAGLPMACGAAVAQGQSRTRPCRRQLHPAEANPEQVKRQRLETMEEDVRARLRQASNPIRVGDISTANGSVSFLVADKTQVDQVRELLQTLTSGAQLTGQRDWDFNVIDETRIVLTPTCSRGRSGGEPGDGHRDRSCPQAHRRAGHSRTDDYPPGCRPDRGTGARSQGSNRAQEPARADREA